MPQRLQLHHLLLARMRALVHSLLLLISRRHLLLLRLRLLCGALPTRHCLPHPAAVCRLAGPVLQV
jgi:hypothetical protein